LLLLDLFLNIVIEEFRCYVDLPGLFSLLLILILVVVDHLDLRSCGEHVSLLKKKKLFFFDYYFDYDCVSEFLRYAHFNNEPPLVVKYTSVSK
jgi:hypothetical protein